MIVMVAYAQRSPFLPKLPYNQYQEPSDEFVSQQFPSSGFSSPSFPSAGFSGPGFPGAGLPGAEFPNQGFPNQMFPNQRPPNNQADFNFISPNDQNRGDLNEFFQRRPDGNQQRPNQNRIPFPNQNQNQNPNQIQNFNQNPNQIQNFNQNQNPTPIPIQIQNSTQDLPVDQAVVFPFAAPALPPAFLKCMREDCLTTSEYNPVCGTDRTIYQNDRKLDCANFCGKRTNSNWQGNVDTS